MAHQIYENFVLSSICNAMELTNNIIPSKTKLQIMVATIAIIRMPPNKALKNSI
jgi:hypothetical protein